MTGKVKARAESACQRGVEPLAAAVRAACPSKTSSANGREPICSSGPPRDGSSACTTSIRSWPMTSPSSSTTLGATSDGGASATSAGQPHAGAYRRASGVSASSSTCRAARLSARLGPERGFILASLASIDEPSFVTIRSALLRMLLRRRSPACSTACACRIACACAALAAAASQQEEEPSRRGGATAAAGRAAAPAGGAAASSGVGTSSAVPVRVERCLGGQTRTLASVEAAGPGCASLSSSCRSVSGPVSSTKLSPSSSAQLCSHARMALARPSRNSGSRCFCAVSAEGHSSRGRCRSAWLRCSDAQACLMSFHRRCADHEAPHSWTEMWYET